MRFFGIFVYILSPYLPVKYSVPNIVLSTFSYGYIYYDYDDKEQADEIYLHFCKYIYSTFSAIRTFLLTSTILRNARDHDSHIPSEIGLFKLFQNRYSQFDYKYTSLKKIRQGQPVAMLEVHSALFLIFFGNILLSVFILLVFSPNSEMSGFNIETDK